jgi:hypothetical protein
LRSISTPALANAATTASRNTTITIFMRMDYFTPTPRGWAAPR